MKNNSLNKVSKNFQNLSALERLSWICLARSENIGSITFFRLLDIFGSPSVALEQTPDFVAKVGAGKKIKICSKSEAEKEILQAEKFGAEILLFGDEAYPRLLRSIDDPAPILTIMGRKELLNQDAIGIVGPRNGSFHACKFAEKISQDLGLHNVVIVSGLARGVDAAAHRGALKSGTVAVIGGGMSNIYPQENAELYKQIYDAGVVVSEVPFGVFPKASNFIQRNRIISAISYGIVVVEAGIQSGSLVTARFALEQGREVFAVPGSPVDPRCAGSNMLLEDGAIFTQNADKVLREMPSLRMRFSDYGKLAEPDLAKFEDYQATIPSDEDLAKARSEIMQRIGFETITIEEIVEFTNIPARLVNIALVQLELAELISVNYGRVAKK